MIYSYFRKWKGCSLLDRKKNFFNNNLTVCEEDCDFFAYNNINGKAIYSCIIKTDPLTKNGDMVIDKDKLFNRFSNFKNIANKMYWNLLNQFLN